MNYQDQIPNLLEVASALNVTDEIFIRTLTDEAKMLSGIPPEDILEDHPETL